MQFASQQQRLLLTTLFLAFAGFTTACRCFPPALEGSFNKENFTTVRTWITSKSVSLSSTDINGDSYYRAYAIRVYKGCEIERRDRFLVKSANGSSLCGFKPDQFSQYLLTGSAKMETPPGSSSPQKVLRINSCDFQRKWGDLDKSESKFLAGQPAPNCSIDKSCPPEICVGASRAPNFLCPDGETTFGPTGICSFVEATQECRYGFVQCPKCNSDKDCKSSQYCAGGECRKDGTCRNTRDCTNPSNRVPVFVRCLYNLQCDITGAARDGKCKAVCGGQCPNGERPVNCFASPCQVTKCNEKYVTCVDNFCGGCNAHFYNAQGDAVCTKGSGGILK